MNDLRMEMENVLGVERGTRPTLAFVTPLGGSTSTIAGNGFEHEHSRQSDAHHNIGGTHDNEGGHYQTTCE